MSEVLLDVKGLKKYFTTKRGLLHAVDDVTFTIEKGKTLGVVGESGCGKSTTGRAILRLHEPTGGQVLFEGQDVAKLNATELRHKRKEMQIIFQDPFSSLNPRKTVSQTIEEPLKLHKLIPDKQKRLEKVLETMAYVLPKGKQLHETMHRTIAENEARMVENFTPEEQAQFVSLLLRAIANMGVTNYTCKFKEESDE